MFSGDMFPFSVRYLKFLLLPLLDKFDCDTYSRIPIIQTSNNDNDNYKNDNE